MHLQLQQNWNNKLITYPSEFTKIKLYQFFENNTLVYTKAPKIL